MIYAINLQCIETGNLIEETRYTDVAHVYYFALNTAHQWKQWWNLPNGDGYLGLGAGTRIYNPIKIVSIYELKFVCK